MPVVPTVHTFDPLIAGKIGLYIDSPPSADMVLWLASKAQGGAKTQVGITYPNTTIGLDGLTFVIDAGAPGTVTYWQAKLHDSGGYGTPSAEIAATTSAGPPTPTAQQDLSAAIGQAVNVGDQVALYAQPSVIKTVQADGSLA